MYKIIYLILTLFIFPEIAQAESSSLPLCIKKFDSWAVYQYQANGVNIRYALSSPLKVRPAKFKDAKSYFLISRRANSSIYDINLLEPQFLSGYLLKRGSRVKLNVIYNKNLSRDFNMYIKNSCAWLYLPTEERVLLFNMRKGRYLKLRAQNADSNDLTYIFSLRGFNEALAYLKTGK